MYRLHSIRRSVVAGEVVATYRDDDRAFSPISADTAKADFLARCDREIASAKKALAEWETTKRSAEAITESDFQPAFL